MGQNGEQNRIRLLRADEIECRIGTVSEKGISLLLYKDARVDMRILDEVFGPMNWQRKHEAIGGSLYCTVSVWDDVKKQWISKMDVGTESHTEKIKGQASDSFKRACYSLGIGRELYTAPFIWISSGKVRIEKRQDGRLYAQDKFTVSDISYNEGNRAINGLVIVNRDGNKVYELKAGKTTVPDQTEAWGLGNLRIRQMRISLQSRRNWRGRVWHWIRSYSGTESAAYRRWTIRHIGRLWTA